MRSIGGLKPLRFLALVLLLAVLGVRVASAQGDGAALHLRVAMKAVDEGEFEIALDEVREAAKLAPTDPIIQFAMATILDKREKVDEALAALDKAQTLGLPEEYREKADDLRVTLLYKQKKNLKAPPTGATPDDSTLEERFFGPRPMPLPVPGPIVATTVTKENGSYFVKLPDGLCIVEFQLPGFKVYRYEVSGSQGMTIEVRMAVAGSLRLVNAGRPPRGGANTAFGMVTDISGGVLPGVTVTVYKP
ncbi:MAG: hypothetical protein ABL961_12490 [Vicinamibacterales bacterium]